VGIKEPGSEAAWVPQAKDFHVDLKKFFISGDFTFVLNTNTCNLKFAFS
jgi:hypothetical protein